MPRKLIRMKVDRIDLVDKGANQQANIVLAKRDVKKDSPSLSSVHVDAPGDERDEYEKAILSSESRNALPDSAFAAVWTDSSGKKQRKLPYKHADGSIDTGHLTAALGRIDGADIPADIKARARRKLEGASGSKKEKSVGKNILKSLIDLFGEKDETKRAEELQRLSKAVDDEEAEGEGEKKPKPKPDAKDEDVAKRDLEIAKQMDELKATNATLKKQAEDAMALAKAERDSRLDREMTEVLKSFKATPFNIKLDDPKNDVARFRKMRETDSELFDRTMELMKATDAQIAESTLFKQFGSSQPGIGSAWSQIEAKAEAMVSKSAAPLTREQAIERVMLENPKLVTQYRAEQQ